MSKSSKYILAGGCSFTNENFKSPWHPEMDFSYDKWPTILGDELNLLVKNLGANGLDNTQIYHRVATDIIENHDKIELVVIGWSQHTRFMVYDNHDHHPSLYIKHLDKHKETASNFTKSAIEYYRWIEDNNYLNEITIEVLFNRIYLIQKLCDNFGIKHLQASLCGQFNDRTIMNADSHMDIINAKSFSKVRRKNMIGWPFSKLLGGFEYDHTDKVHWVSDIDKHPNKKGHEEIAKLYYDKYKKIYL